MSIYFNSENKTFYLESKDVTYAMKIHKYGYLEHIYYGARVGREDLEHVIIRNMHSFNTAAPGTTDYAAGLNNMTLEMPTYGRGDFRECMIQLEHPNGVRLCDMRYESHEILDKKPELCGMPSVKGGETLIVTLKDTVYDISVKLYYTVFEDVATILRHAEIINNCGHSVNIRRAYSFAIDLPENNYDLISLYGAWAKERHIERTPMHHGTFVVDSKRGSSSAILNPFIAAVSKDTTEYNGKVYAVNLVYSSSWVLKAQAGQDGNSRLLGGINDFDFSWKLDSGDSFTTPEAVMVYSDSGLNAMSQTFHDTYRKYLINPRYVNASRPVVINNWEGTYFNFDNEKLISIMDAVAGTGIDTFVLDDGWFGIRDNDDKSLGDWFVNTDKLKGGLKTVIDHCHSLGMKFGLWFEPEMISPNSDLYRAHPDWCIRTPDYEPTLSRNQLILDITRPEVRDHIVNVISKVVRENKIDYVKWDSNRNMTENYSLALDEDRQKEYHHRYALGLYELCDRLVNGLPEVIFEGCSGGGARFDGAMLYYFPQIWTSDDSDAYMRTKIQYGTSMCYPLSAMSCHTSICPNHQTGRTLPFASRADIAHLGATGYELDTANLSDEEKSEIPKQVAAYHEMEDLVLKGDLYRLEDPFNSNFFCFELVSKDRSKAHITYMRAITIPMDEHKRIYPRGLDPEADYNIRERGLTLKGKTIMNAGITMDIGNGDFKTVVFHIEKV